MVTDWDKERKKKEDLTMCLQVTHFRFRGKYGLKENQQKRHSETKEAEVAIFISDRIDFKPKVVTNDERLYRDKGINPSRRYNKYKHLYFTSKRHTILVKPYCHEIKLLLWNFRHWN